MVANVVAGVCLHIHLLIYLLKQLAQRLRLALVLIEAVVIV